ncbi:MAG TPA: N-acetylmuramoyl-L-alanine amidase [Bacilli bacterium]|nr:N-acetylmuramoyl-L-alanine amidase [Bacilli bacterium]
MSYSILARPIRYNHDGTKLVPQGVVIHSTATPEATDEDEIAYFNAANRDSSAHYFIDDDSISRAIAEGEVAWHAGSTANHKYIGLELCEFRDEKKFLEVWKRAVWLTADICRRYGFGVDNVFSHREISATYHETNHTDPDGYFAAHGKTWAQFKADVQAALREVTKANTTGVPAPAPLTYTVVAGDTLWGLAKKFHLTVDQLKQWNGLTSNLIRVGQVLKIAPPESPPVAKTPILGRSVATGEQMIEFVRTVNPSFDPHISEAFLQLGETYGIRGDIAFCQAIHETNFFRFTGDVKPEQNNFCGLGATGNGNPGNSFATIEEGVRAQMQHLYGYATEQFLPAGEPLVDPRFKYIPKGSAPNWEDLAGKWAVPGYDRTKFATLEAALQAGATYGQSIVKLHKQLPATVVPPTQSAEPPKPSAPSTEQENPDEWLKQAIELLNKYYAHVNAK